MKKFIFIFFIFLMAQGSWAGSPGHHVSATAMVLASSTRQGGQGPQGSTILSQTEYVYNWPSYFGLGLFYQADKQGASEVDTFIGPKLEFHYHVFYLELGYAVITQRSFTDRSIAEQKGSGFFTGFGVRFSLGAGNVGGFFFQASYKLRQFKITEQDGVDLGEPIEQSDSYPLFGLGYLF